MMVRARRPLVAGNWKMNGLRSSAAELSRIIQGAKELGAVDLMLCPPATLIALFAAAVAGSAVRIGAQRGPLCNHLRGRNARRTREWTRAGGRGDTARRLGARRCHG